MAAVPATGFKLRYRQTGGFAGLTKGLSWDGEAPSQEDLAQVRRLAEAADFYRVSVVSKSAGPDMLDYELELADGGRKHAIRCHTGNVPESLWPLIEFLSERAKYK